MHFRDPLQRPWLRFFCHCVKDRICFASAIASHLRCRWQAAGVMSAAALKVALSFSESLYTEIRPHWGNKRSGAGKRKGHGNARTMPRKHETVTERQSTAYREMQMAKQPYFRLRSDTITNSTFQVHSIVPCPPQGPSAKAVSPSQPRSSVQH